MSKLTYQEVEQVLEWLCNQHSYTLTDVVLLASGTGTCLPTSYNGVEWCEGSRTAAKRTDSVEGSS